MQVHERIYVALDTTDVVKALKIAEVTAGKVGGHKIGLEFITSILVQLVTLNLTAVQGLLQDFRELMKAIGENLFWDGKFDDIPNTIAGASLGLEPLSPKFFNVHASADFEAVREAVKNKGTSKVLAVTLLTSIHPVRCEMMFGQSVRAVVKKWALSAVVEGHADGLICSPADLGWINEEEKLVGVPKMTPGIRPEFSQKGDQKRVMTPAEAVRAGSTWLVIGRPITGYPEGPAVAVDRIVEELAAVG